ncbi:3084_t:CDS:2 [Funneliformis geosporum]|nr:3084_t:CDS:2 [Funneliformis geosporum]
MIGIAKITTIFAGILTFLGIIGPASIMASPIPAAIPNPISIPQQAQQDESLLVARETLTKRRKIVGSGCSLM